MHTDYQSGNLKARDHLGDIGAGVRIILKRILKKYGVKMWAGFIWLRIGISGGFRVTSRLGICSMEHGGSYDVRK
jgi:hypothetical protein